VPQIFGSIRPSEASSFGDLIFFFEHQFFSVLSVNMTSLQMYILVQFAGEDKPWL
jgi:hypothetical protein